MYPDLTAEPLTLEVLSPLCYPPHHFYISLFKASSFQRVFMQDTGDSAVVLYTHARQAVFKSSEAELHSSSDKEVCKKHSGVKQERAAEITRPPRVNVSLMLERRAPHSPGLLTINSPTRKKFLFQLRRAKRKLA